MKRKGVAIAVAKVGGIAVTVSLAGKVTSLWLATRPLAQLGTFGSILQALLSLLGAVLLLAVFLVFAAPKEDVDPADKSGPKPGTWPRARADVVAALSIIAGLAIIFVGLVALLDQDWPSSGQRFYHLFLLIGAVTFASVRSLMEQRGRRDWWRWPTDVASIGGIGMLLDAIIF